MKTSFSAPQYFKAALQSSRRGAGAEAIELYSRAIELDPDFASAYYNRGREYDTLGQLEKAIADYGRSLELSPSADAYYNRGLAYRNLSDFAAAIADYDRAIALDSMHARAWNNRGNALYLLGDFAAAIESYSACLSIDRGFAPAWYQSRLRLR